MASTYNGSVANLVDPLTTSPLNSPSHAGQHTEINDALQTLGTYTAYTPTYGGFTLGNGTVTARYTQFNKTVHYHGVITLGSTSVMTGPLDISVPANYSSTHYPLVTEMGGVVMLYDASPGVLYAARMIALFGGTFRCVRQTQQGATEISVGDMTATVPFTWTTSDSISWNLIYEAA